MGNSLPQKVISSGPIEAKVLIVGEAPGEQEVLHGIPFVGGSGRELDAILREGGLDRAACHITNVCHQRPPDTYINGKLKRNDIAAFMPKTAKEAKEKGATLLNNKWVMPPIIEGLNALRLTMQRMPNLELVLGAGNTALWGLCSQDGITKWRGSQMHTSFSGRQIPFVPILHPASIMRQWSTRWFTVLDVKRAMRWQRERYRVPRYELVVRPSFGMARDFLVEILHRLENLAKLAAAGIETLPLAVDIETRAGHIACLGIADSPRTAFCIPFMESGGSYFNLGEEIFLIGLLSDILRHPAVRIIGQNYLYDRQYIAKWWGCRSRLDHDTMVKQHVCFPGVSKGLDFISSQHNDYHYYWKDESKDWDPSVGEEQLWAYNGKDACATFEANGHLDNCISTFKFDVQLAEQMAMGEIAFDAMLRGIPVDFEYRRSLSDHPDLDRDQGSIAKQMRELQDFVDACIGYPLLISSPPQVHRLCYEVFKLPHKHSTTTGALTASKDAIAEWRQTCEPIYRPILKAIEDWRSLQVFRSTFARAPIDPDGNFRCEIKVTGAETFRWSTGADAFGYGGNMQNLPKGDED